MKNIFLSATLLAAALFSMSSCHSHDDSNHAHPHGLIDNTQIEELATLSFTERKGRSELFVEFEPMLLNNETSFAAHYTDIESFKPYEKGKLSIQLIEDKRIIDKAEIDYPSSSGIFRPILTPSQTGVFDLQFVIQTVKYADTIILSNVKVYENREKALVENPIMDGGSSDISYLKEQAWKVDFAVEEVENMPIHQVINVAGEFQSLKGDERMISSKRSGIVTYKNPRLQKGKELKLGETVFSVSSQGLIENNLGVKIQSVKSELDRAKSDFKRAEKLFSDRILGSKEFEKRKADYQIAQSKYNSLTTNGNENISQSLSSPISGIIKNIMVSNGQYVNEGDPLMVVSQNRKIQLVAEVPQQYQSQLYNIKSAKFKTPSSKEVKSIDDYKGKLITVGSSVDDNSGFIPLVFELQNIGKLVAGTFTEVYLQTNQTQNATVIPKSALMKDYGYQYVYVQKGGESFEKREVQLGIDDGKSVQIISGLTHGELIVTKGAYQIKMASMSNSIPAHGHSH